MKKIFLLSFICCVLLVSFISPVNAVTHQELAERWAPRLYHDTNDAYDYEAEYFTLFNYDGDCKSMLMDKSIGMNVYGNKIMLLSITCIPSKWVLMTL